MPIIGRHLYCLPVSCCSATHESSA